ncbi:uncharacterized protein PFLUO_LOCUS2251 [Penicillium psychrofluorescens]|uniref:uncharacterized protein n=1 Tax=Penicillium psychrofluorescens TaxID=3158075 RepID=UPI003CCD9F53
MNGSGSQRVYPVNHHLINLTNNTYTSVPAPVAQGICGHICQWLWSGWRGTAFEDPPVNHDPPRRAPNRANSPADCKACREWQVPCDQAHPQCSHCWQQQILCFYVTPKVKPKRGQATGLEPSLDTPDRQIANATG